MTLLGLATADVAGCVDLVRRHGFVSPADIHHLGLRAWDASRSHQVVVIETGQRPGLVVKVPRRDEDDRQGSAARERAAYRLAATTPELAGLTPRVLATDADGALVTQRAVGTALSDLLVAARRHDAALLGAAAELIGRWHRHAPTQALAPVRPWVLDACGPDRPGFLGSNEGARSLVRERTAEWAGGLAAAAASWVPEAAVHGDVRLDNVIVGEHGAVLIDWECAGAGDPAWDLGSLLSEVLVRAGVRRVTSRLVPQVGHAVVTVVERYQAEAARPASRGWQQRVGLACGARVAMRALQTASRQPDPEPGTGELADLATQLLDHPECIRECL